MGITFWMDTDRFQISSCDTNTDFKAFFREISPRPSADLVALAEALGMDLLPLLKVAHAGSDDDMHPSVFEAPIEDHEEIRRFWAEEQAWNKSAWQDIIFFEDYLNQWLNRIHARQQDDKHQGDPFEMTMVISFEALKTMIEIAKEGKATQVRMCVE